VHVIPQFVWGIILALVALEVERTEPHEDKTCDGALGCFGLNIVCVGEYRCLEQTQWGCVKAVCIEEDRD
jgi:hypothetical protein